MVEVRGFGFNPGALRMLAYVPQGCPTGAPLVVVLHGCTQRAGAHAAAAGWLTLADRLGFVVVAPEQESQNNPNRCFNWFETGDITRGAGEAASIHAMVQHMMRTHDVDPARVFVTGLSAGGAMAAVMLATYPELFAAGAVIAGLPYGVAQGMHEAFGAMHGGGSRSDRELVDLVTSAAPWPGRAPRLSVWHGGADQTVKPSNGVALARQWAGVHGLGQPDEVEERAGRVRSVWRGRDGEVLVEMNVVAGLGHGVPLATTGDDPLGVVAPFMLEANVSSSLEISRFWGIASPATPDRGWNTAPAEDPHQAGGRRAPVGEQVMASVAPHVPQDIQQVIAKALGAAGLMR
ncbi:PHB depolymerase family esterase [Phenylobacterium sp.]|uniref:extracellular catalytic domain type 1 short-chain-length polyhydroxyalkanoate depolymerase n=1 Tax=Phenylobacterium sp. TaxID=1871053 RepID=UPI002F95118E